MHQVSKHSPSPSRWPRLTLLLPYVTYVTWHMSNRMRQLYCHLNAAARTRARERKRKQYGTYTRATCRERMRERKRNPSRTYMQCILFLYRARTLAYKWHLHHGTAEGCLSWYIASPQTRLSLLTAATWHLSHRVTFRGLGVCHRNLMHFIAKIMPKAWYRRRHKNLT